MFINISTIAYINTTPCSTIKDKSNMIPLNNILKGFTILLITFFNYPYYYTQTILENGGFEDGQGNWSTYFEITFKNYDETKLYYLTLFDNIFSEFLFVREVATPRSLKENTKYSQ